MPRKIADIKAELDTAEAQARLANMRASIAEAKVEKLIEELQTTCKHSKTQEESDYCGGGYDYCASTTYRVRCLTCAKVVKHWTKDHHGIYG